MSDLEKLPNIGKVLAEKLSEIGINNEKQLKETGSENTFIQLSAYDNESCLNMLYAIEGAIQGIRWHNLSKEKKEELKLFFNQVKKIQK